MTRPGVGEALFKKVREGPYTSYLTLPYSWKVVGKYLIEADSVVRLERLQIHNYCMTRILLFLITCSRFIYKSKSMPISEVLVMTSEMRVRGESDKVKANASGASWAREWVGGGEVK